MALTNLRLRRLDNTIPRQQTQNHAAHPRDNSRTSQLCFYDLAAELRNCIYSLCCISADGTTISVARGRNVPPSLALVSHQVREEFLGLWYFWSGRNDISVDTRHIRLAVFDLNFDPATLVWEKAIAAVESNGRMLDSVTIVFVFTKAGSTADARQSLQRFVEWCECHVKPICPEEALRWNTVDYRRFGKLKQGQLLLLGARVIICQRWKSMRAREAWKGAAFTVKMWWQSHARGIAGG